MYVFYQMIFHKATREVIIKQTRILSTRNPFTPRFSPSRNPLFPKTVRESKLNKNVQILLCKTRKTIGTMSKLRVRGSVWLITQEGVSHI